MAIENFGKPIKTDSIEEHEKILGERMIKIQLSYVDALSQGKILPLDKDVDTRDIATLIIKYTEISSRLEEEYRSRTDVDIFDKKSSDLFMQKIIDKISLLYEEDKENWIKKTEQLIKEETEKLGPVQKKEDEEKAKAGLIDFNITTNLGDLLSSVGISDDDFCIGIHFPDFYKQEGTTSLFSVRKSFRELALKIIDEYGETKAVVAESWLVSTPIFKKIGFTILDANPKRELGGQFWGQFMDIHGQVDEKKVSEFLETGKPPYKVSVGVMMVEDFLKKYLPEERKGEIDLKSRRSGFIEKLEKEKIVLRNMLKNLDEVSNKDIEDQISQCEIFGNFSKKEKGRGFIDMIINLKEKGVPVEKMESEDSFKKYGKFFKEYIKEQEFIKRKVVI